METLVRTYVVDDQGAFTPLATNRYTLLLEGRYSFPRWRKRALRLAHLELPTGSPRTESFLELRLDPNGKPTGDPSPWKPTPALVRALRRDADNSVALAATFSHLARNLGPIQPTVRRPHIDQGGCR